MNETATCLSGYEWSFSSTNQSPCEVATELAAICEGGQFNLAPLVSGVVYLGPTVESANDCMCSSVYYALLSACAYCQARSYIRWTSYAINCSTVYLQRFVEPIPSGINVPLWAYQDILIDDNFNVTLAQINATNTLSITSTPSRAAGATGGESNTVNVAALAGGLVGGLVMIGFVVGFLTFCLTRRRQRSSHHRHGRTGETQTQDLGRPTIAVTPSVAPGFSSSVMLKPISMPRNPHPLSQSISMDNPPPPLSSQRVPLPVTAARNLNVQLTSASTDEYLMTKVTPYTMPPPITPITPYTSSSQDSKQALLAGTPSNFSDMPTTSSAVPNSAFVPENDSKSPAPAFRLASSSSLPYRPHYQEASSMSPLSSNEPLPPYSEIMAGSSSPSPRAPVLEKQWP